MENARSVRRLSPQELPALQDCIVVDALAIIENPNETFDPSSIDFAILQLQKAFCTTEVIVQIHTFICKRLKLRKMEEYIAQTLAEVENLDDPSFERTAATESFVNGEITDEKFTLADRDDIRGEAMMAVTHNGVHEVDPKEDHEYMLAFALPTRLLLLSTIDRKIIENVIHLRGMIAMGDTFGIPLEERKVLAESLTYKGRVKAVLGEPKKEESPAFDDIHLRRITKLFLENSEEPGPPENPVVLKFERK